MPEEMILTHVIIQYLIFLGQSESGILLWDYIQSSEGCGFKSCFFVFFSFSFLFLLCSFCETVRICGKWTQAVHTSMWPVLLPPEARMDGVK